MPCHCAFATLGIVIDSWSTNDYSSHNLFAAAMVRCQYACKHCSARSTLPIGYTNHGQVGPVGEECKRDKLNWQLARYKNGRLFDSRIPACYAATLLARHDRELAAQFRDASCSVVDAQSLSSYRRG